MAPELLNHQKYTSKVDLWALGCILYEIVFHEHPFNCDRSQSCINKQLTFPDDIKVSKDMIKLIIQLLEKDQNQRIDVGTFFSLPFVMDCIRDAQNEITTSGSANGILPCNISEDINTTAKRQKLHHFSCIPFKN